MTTITVRKGLAAALVLSASVTAGLMRGHASGPEREPVYYNDEIYLAMSPGANSENPHQFGFECFSLGPDLNAKGPAESTPLYAVLWSGGAHSCADGSFAHDHVATAIPGTPGFKPHWRLIFVIPISSDVVLPLTSADAVEDAAAAGQVVLIDTGLIALAPLVRHSGS